MNDILGTSNNDNLVGTDFDDTINGLNGADIINGGKGEDRIYGWSGNDIIDGGEGNDRINAGSGNDRVITSEGTDYLKTGSGNDTLVVSGDKGKTVWSDFTAGEDKIELNMSKELFEYLVSIESTGRNDEHTTITIGDTKIKLKNVESTSINIDNFIFNEPELNLVTEKNARRQTIGTDADDKVVGTDGRDDLYGGRGNDLLIGKDGADSLGGSFGNDTLIGGDGDDRLSGAIGDDIMIGGDGNDRIQPGPGNNDIVYGGKGADTIDVYKNYFNKSWLTNVTWMDFEGGVDKIQISYIIDDEEFYNEVSIDDDGQGNTIIKYAELNTIILTGIDAADISIEDFILRTNIILGTSNDDILVGANIDNTIRGYKGADTIYGGERYDRIFGGSGDDTIFGGEDGDDINGEHGNDTIDGGKGDDRIFGWSGSDIIDGGEGNDKINAGSGNDRVITSQGTDYIKTGSGHDTLVVSLDIGKTIWSDFIVEDDKIEFDISEELFEYLGSIKSTGSRDEHTTIKVGGSEIRLKNVEFDTLSSDNFVFNGPELNLINAEFTTDQTIGTDADDKIVGTSGKDNLHGGRGDDLIIGDEGSDTLHGSYGNDTLIGGDGDDRLLGAIGDDIMIGGDGNDRIQPGPGDNDIVYGGQGADAIDVYDQSRMDWFTNVTWMDFEDGVDKIDIKGTGISFSEFFDNILIDDDEQGNTVITYLEENTITLVGIDEFDITIDDFIF